MVNEIADIFQRDIVDSGKLPQLFLLSSFLLSFGFIRFSAHMIRKQVSWWPGNVKTKGGLHIHHMVWGIITMIIVGYVSIALYPDPPVREALAVLFGIGMGLTLDEFALWLNLKDVYWSQDGRESIDAVLIAAALAGMLLIGVQFWVDLSQQTLNELFDVSNPSQREIGGHLVVAAAQLISISFAVISLMKRKLLTSAVGLFIPIVALVGALRLAKPGSRWARWRYSDAKMSRAEARFGEATSG